MAILDPMYISVCVCVCACIYVCEYVYVHVHCFVSSSANSRCLGKVYKNALSII